MGALRLVNFLEGAYRLCKRIFFSVYFIFQFLKAGL